jgi:hypothetical protein
MSGRQEFLDIYDEHRVKDQIGWYKSRSEEYKKADGQAFLLTQLMLFGAAACGIIGSLAPQAREELGLAAAILAVLATFISGWASLIGFSENAQLYKHALAGLSHVRPGRTKAAESDEELVNYMDRAEGVLLGEVRSWAEQWSNFVAPSEATSADPPPAE